MNQNIDLNILKFGTRTDQQSKRYRSIKNIKGIDSPKNNLEAYQAHDSLFGNNR